MKQRNIKNEEREKETAKRRANRKENPSAHTSEKEASKVQTTKQCSKKQERNRYVDRNRMNDSRNKVLKKKDEESHQQGEKLKEERGLNQHVLFFYIVHFSFYRILCICLLILSLIPAFESLSNFLLTIAFVLSVCAF